MQPPCKASRTNSRSLAFTHLLHVLHTRNIRNIVNCIIYICNSFNKCKSYLSPRSHGAVFERFRGLVFALPSVKSAEILQSGCNRRRVHLRSFVPTAIFTVRCVLLVSVLILFPLFSYLKRKSEALLITKVIKNRLL